MTSRWTICRTHFLLNDFTDDQTQDANQQFRNLVTLHIRITLLSDVFATAGYAHGRSAIGLLQTLMSNTSPQVVSDLGSLHRASIWENIILKVGLASKGIDVLPTPTSSPLEGSPDQANISLPETDGAATTNGTDAVQPEASAVPSSSPQKDVPKLDGPRELNAAALKHLTRGLPTSLAPFFQGKQSRHNGLPDTDDGVPL
jgi:E3 ubiquitin-protein ligase HUWE1